MNNKPRNASKPATDDATFYHRVNFLLNFRGGPAFAIAWMTAAFPLLFPAVRGDDWPGLLGPHRNGHSDGPAIGSTPPADRLSAIWSLPAGQGYAGAAVAAGRAILYDRSGDEDRVQCVEFETGNIVWSRSLPAVYDGGVDSDHGPRCTPTIAGDQIIVYSAAGELTSLALQDGSFRWTRALSLEFKADAGYFGAGSTPLVVGDRIIVNVGGKLGGIVAVSRIDGATLWTATNFDASYASPTLFPLDVNQPIDAVAVVPTRLKTVGVRVDTGKVLWEFNFGQRGPTVNAATPILVDNQLFLTAAYGIGNVAYSIAPDATRIDPTHQGDQLSSQYASPVGVQGFVYGSDGREDMGSEGFKCLDPSTGDIVWSRPEFPICHVVVIEDSQLLLVGIDGSLRLLNADASKYVPIWTTKLGEGKYRSLPALADGRLLVRTVGPNGRWECFELPRR